MCGEGRGWSHAQVPCCKTASYATRVPPRAQGRRKVRSCAQLCWKAGSTKPLAPGRGRSDWCCMQRCWCVCVEVSPRPLARRGVAAKCLDNGPRPTQKPPPLPGAISSGPPTDSIGGQALPLGVQGGGGRHKASVSDCLPLAAPIGLSPLLILTGGGGAIHAERVCRLALPGVPMCSPFEERGWGLGEEDDPVLHDLCCWGPGQEVPVGASVLHCTIGGGAVRKCVWEGAAVGQEMCMGGRSGGAGRGVVRGWKTIPRDTSVGHDQAL